MIYTYDDFVKKASVYFPQLTIDEIKLLNLYYNCHMSYSEIADFLDSNKAFIYREIKRIIAKIDLQLYFMKSYKQKLIEERLQSLYGNSYDSEVKRNIYFYSADLRKKVLKLTLYSLMYVALMFIAVVLIETLATVYQRSRYTAEEWYFVENCDYFDNDIKFYAEVNDEQYFIVYINFLF